jgi:hypothetical protein
MSTIENKPKKINKCDNKDDNKDNEKIKTFINGYKQTMTRKQLRDIIEKKRIEFKIVTPPKKPEKPKKFKKNKSRFSLFNIKC